MNFLAHLLLSGSNTDVLLGNFIADAVKGNQFRDYPQGVQKGILLHRFIDDFTDSHPIVLDTKILFRPVYHKLSPILVDILYDHYLAKDWHRYHHQHLRVYVDHAYSFLQTQKGAMPERIRFMLPYMIQHDWLYNYQFQSGMERVLFGMSKRVSQGEILKHGWKHLTPVYDQVQEHFECFMQEVIQATESWLTDAEVNV